MPDMLVKLFDLPPLQPALETARRAGYEIHRVAPEHNGALVDWVRERFEGWVDEVKISLSRTPPTCFMAAQVRRDGNGIGAIAGFACYDASYLNFFGPTGVDEQARGRGIGRALALSVLQAQADQGYAYAIIGRIGPAGFYRRAVGASLIEHGVADGQAC